jgi:hypothetical protein
MWNSSKHDQLRSEIKHIFENGTLEEKMNIVETMYNDYGEFDNDVKIENMFIKSHNIHIDISSKGNNKPIVLTRNLYGGRWKKNNSLISLYEVSEILGVPIAFIAGVLFALESCPSVDNNLNELEDLRLKTEEDTKVKTESEVFKDMSDIIHSTKVYKNINRDPREVPEPTFTSKQIGLLKEKICGVYIEWEDCKPSYVGSSNNIPSRLRRHEIVNKENLVSIIACDVSERIFEECYFIHILRPYKNKATPKRLNI